MSDFEARAVADDRGETRQRGQVRRSAAAAWQGIRSAMSSGLRYAQSPRGRQVIGQVLVVAAVATVAGVVTGGPGAAVVLAGYGAYRGARLALRNRQGQTSGQASTQPADQAPHTPAGAVHTSAASVGTGPAAPTPGDEWRATLQAEMHAAVRRALDAREREREQTQSAGPVPLPNWPLTDHATDMLGVLAERREQAQSAGAVSGPLSVDAGELLPASSNSRPTANRRGDGRPAAGAVDSRPVPRRRHAR